MNILLTTLPREGEYDSWITPAVAEPAGVKHLPLGLLSLATNIRDYHQVHIIDPFSEHWDLKYTIDWINNRGVDLVGISAVTRRTYALYEMLKRINVPWKVVGGPHCTYHAEDVMEYGADAAFIGQLADFDFLHWLTSPERGIFKCDKTDINELAYPERRLMDYQSYFYNGGKVLFSADKRMNMFSSVGCPNRCNFCSVQSKKTFRKSAYMVVQEMCYLKNLGAGSVHLMDDNFNTSANHVSDVCRQLELVGWETEWSIRGQIKFDLRLVPRMKSLGLKRIHVGVEAIDDNILKWMGKRHTVEDIKNFCKTMNENDVDVLAYFIVGTPLESDEYLKALPDKIRDLGIKHPYMNILYPQPDTDYYWGLLKDGTYKEDVWKEYFKRPTPGYKIPSPFGDSKLLQKMEYAENIIKEFSGL